MDNIIALEMFAALSQPTRLQVVRFLIRQGPEGCAAGDIADHLDVRQNTMSANLKILHQSGLVGTERQGRSIRYFIRMEALRGLIGFLMKDCCGGRPEVCQPVLDELGCEPV